MIETLVGVGFVVLAVGALVGLGIWVSRMRVTEVKGEKPESEEGKEYLTEDDISDLLVEDEPEDPDAE